MLACGSAPRKAGRRPRDLASRSRDGSCASRLRAQSRPTCPGNLAAMLVPTQMRRSRSGWRRRLAVLVQQERRSFRGSLRTPRGHGAKSIKAIKRNIPVGIERTGFGSDSTPQRCGITALGAAGSATELQAVPGGQTRSEGAPHPPGGPRLSVDTATADRFREVTSFSRFDAASWVLPPPGTTRASPTTVVDVREARHCADRISARARVTRDLVR